MKFVITGVTGFRNRGVEALVQPTIEQLLTRYPEAQITILTKTPDFDSLQISSPTVKLIKDTVSCVVSGHIRRFRVKGSGIWPRLAPGFQTAKRVIQQASVVIALGGDVFSSDYGGLYRHLAPLRIAQKSGVPVVFMGHSIGPFKHQSEVDSWLEVARRSILITVREEISYRYLVKKLGLTGPEIFQTADVAFLLKPTPPNNASSWKHVYGLDSERPTVVVAPSQGISRFASVDYGAHVIAWSTVIKMLVDELRVQVAIVPHVQETHLTNDDRILATEVFRHLDNVTNVRFIGANHTAGEFKSLIGDCKMVIGERMHSCIAGLASNVCTISIGYSIKARGIMEYLLGDYVDDIPLVIPIQRFLDSDISCSAIKKAWGQQKAIHERLVSIGIKNQQKSLRNFDLLNTVISKQ